MAQRSLATSKKHAKIKGAEIFWLDEASIRSNDPLQRTWGAKGQTPRVKTRSQRQSINAILVLSKQTDVLPV
ncbi:transposase [Zhongshania sp.]|uniref:transposase n=1 Tax=Zhongshania sp. TaxID=1971902 RepID=UPI003561AA14